LLPLLVCFSGAVVAARLLGPLMLLAERLARRGPTTLRLALLALARAPARTAVASAFLVVSIGLAIFAASYRATLARGARDESGFEVPLDLTLSEGQRLVLPLDAASTAGYAGLAPDAHAYPVLRRSADVAGLGTSAQGATVLGIPSPALRSMYWRKDFSSAPRGRLSRAVSGKRPVSLQAHSLPRAATQLVASFQLRGAPLHVDVAFQDARGQVETVAFGRVGRGRTTLTRRISRRLRSGPLRVAALEFSLTQNETNWFFHLSHEGRLVRAPDGDVTLAPLVAEDASGRARSTIELGSCLVPGGGATTRGLRPVRLAYSFQEVQTLVLRPRQPTDSHPLPVIASPDVASGVGPGAVLTLDFQDFQIPARIVSVASRFPTLAEGEPFVVAEET